MKCGTLEEFLHGSQTDLTDCGKCPNGCGECCTNILPCTEYELDRIARYAKKNRITMVRERSSVPMTRYSLDLGCPFRDEEKRKCLVYEVRPTICREYMCSNMVKHIYPEKMLKMVNVHPVLLRAEMIKRGVK